MSIDELLQALYVASGGHKPKDQLAVVLLALYAKALESDDTRSGVWAGLFKDLHADSVSADREHLMEELKEALQDAFDDATIRIDDVFQNYDGGE